MKSKTLGKILILCLALVMVVAIVPFFAQNAKAADEYKLEGSTTDGTYTYSGTYGSLVFNGADSNEYGVYISCGGVTITAVDGYFVDKVVLNSSYNFKIPFATNGTVTGKDTATLTVTDVNAKSVTIGDKNYPQITSFSVTFKLEPKDEFASIEDQYTYTGTYGKAEYGVGVATSQRYSDEAGVAVCNTNGKLVVTANEGYVIDKIVAKAGYNDFSNTTVSAGSKALTDSDKTMTLTDVNAKSVTITSTSAVLIKNLVVVYAKDVLKDDIITVGGGQLTYTGTYGKAEFGKDATATPGCDSDGAYITPTKGNLVITANTGYVIDKIIAHAGYLNFSAASASKGTKALTDSDLTMTVTGINDTTVTISSDNVNVYYDLQVIYVEVFYKAADTTAPTAKLTYNGTDYTTLSTSTEVGIYKNTSASFALTVADEEGGSGIDKVYYIRSASLFTETQLKTKTWTETTDTSFNYSKEATGYLYIKVTDKAGNETYISTPKVCIDKTAPTAKITVNGTEYTTLKTTNAMDYYSNATSISAAVSATDNEGGSGIDKLLFANSTSFMTKADLDAYSSWTNSPATLNLMFASDSNRYIYVKAVDKAGNVGYASFYMQRDTVAPTAKFTIDSVDYTTLKTTSTVDISVNKTTAYALNGVDNENGSGIAAIYHYLDYSVLTADQVKAITAEQWGASKGTTTFNGNLFAAAINAEGIYYHYVKVVDKAGNVGYASCAVRYDTTAPKATITHDTTKVDAALQTSDAINYYKNSGEDISFILKPVDGTGSGIKEVKYISSATFIAPENVSSQTSWMDGTIEDGEVSYTTENEKIRYVYFKIIDNAGNITYVSYNICFDKTAPTAKISFNDKNFTKIKANDVMDYIKNVDVTLNFTGTDNSGGSGVDSKYYAVFSSIKKKADLDAYSEWSTASASKTFTDEGAQYIYLKVVDKAGNVGYASFYLHIDKTAPTAKITVDGTDYTTVKATDAMDYYINKKFQINFSAEDEEGGSTIDKLFYISSNTIMTEEELSALKNKDWNKTGNNTYTTVLLANRTTYVYLKTVDIAGNVGYASFYYQMDKDAPTGKFNYGGKNYTATLKTAEGIDYYVNTGDKLAVKFTAADAYSGVEKIEWAFSASFIAADKVPEISTWADTGKKDSTYLMLEEEKSGYYFVKVTDKTGNVSYFSIGVCFDKTVPTGTFRYNSKNYKATLKTSEGIDYYVNSGENLAVKFTPSDKNAGIAKIEWAFSTSFIAADKASEISTWADTGKTENAYLMLEEEKQGYYYVKVTDKAGNVSYFSIGVCFDKTEPTVKVSLFDKEFTTFSDADTIDVYSNAVTFPFSVEMSDGNSGLAKFEYILLESNKTTAQLKETTGWTELEAKDWNLALSEQTKGYLYVRVTDKAGNVKYVSVGVCWDRVAPTAIITAFGEDYTTFATIADLLYSKDMENEFKGSGTDNSAGIKERRLGFAIGFCSGDELDKVGWSNVSNIDTTIKVESEVKLTIFYKVVDNAGNEAYASIYVCVDITAPVISGVEKDVTYYTTQKFTVTDTNKIGALDMASGVDEVTLDEEVITDYTIPGNVDHDYVLVAVDKAGNITTVTITMKTIASISEPIADLNEDNVKSSDKGDIEDVKEFLENLEHTENATQDELDEIADAIENCEKLLARIEAVRVQINDFHKSYQPLLKVFDFNITRQQAVEASLELGYALPRSNMTRDEKDAADEAIEMLEGWLKEIETKNYNKEESAKYRESHPLAASKFVDVAAKDYFYAAVNWAVNKGVTNGIDDTHFAPATDVTRAQFVTFLYRAAGSPEVSTDNIPFKDVSSDSVYAKAIAWAVAKGIAKGIEVDEFAPNVTVTRAQAITFIYRFAGSPKVSGTSKFADVKESDYYYDAVIWAVRNSIAKGIDDGTYGASTNCTRGQAVTFVYRYCYLASNNIGTSK